MLIQQLTFCFRRRHSVHEVAYLVFPWPRWDCDPWACGLVGIVRSSGHRTCGRRRGVGTRPGWQRALMTDGRRARAEADRERYTVRVRSGGTALKEALRGTADASSNAQCRAASCNKTTMNVQHNGG